jgi:beta-galactosidase
MSLYIDREKKASGEVSGHIRNFPLPVNIGRNAEEHGQGTQVYICDARMDDVGIFTEITDIDRPDPQKAVLWLDFEKEQTKGTFYSYGIGARTYGSIWPDRRPQPEMWQMKKTVQPLAFSLKDAGTGAVEVWNRNHFLDAGHYRTRWFLEADGDTLQQGELTLNTPPLSRESVRIPYTQPSIEAGKEYRLTLSSTLKKDELWAPAGHEVAWEQLELPWRLRAEPPEQVLPAPSYSETSGQVIVSGEHFSYTFDRKAGQLVSIVYEGKEMLRAPLTLSLWRAPLANELDDWNAGSGRSVNRSEGFGNTLATEMYSFGLDRLRHLPLGFEVEKTARSIHIVIKDINLHGQYGCIRNVYDMHVTGDGTMTLHHTLKPEGRMPLWFPRIGITMTLDKSLNRVNWYGRGPQENYPDRKSGYRTGIYHSTVQDMYEPYLLPQDYGLRTDNRWVRMTDDKGQGLQFSSDELFNFNAYPFSTDHLTKAVYTYQLKEQDGVTFNLDYLTSGVGCTALGIFPAYRVMPQMYERTVTIKPVCQLRINKIPLLSSFTNE